MFCSITTRRYSRRSILHSAFTWIPKLELEGYPVNTLLSAITKSGLEIER